MNIAKLLIIAFLSAFLTMIMIYLIKKGTAGKNIPFVSTIADGV